MGNLTRAPAAAICLLAIGYCNGGGGGAPPAGAQTSSPREVSARAARVLGVRDEGRLRLVKSSGSELFEEGPARGTIAATVRLSFVYDGGPSATARVTIYTPRGSIRGTATARVGNAASQTPSFRGSLSISGGSGGYRNASGRGELFGVFYRSSYGMVVQAIGTLRY